MEVVYHSSDTFAPMLGTSIVSLLEQNKNSTNIRIWVIEHGISEKNKDHLREIATRYSREICFIPMPDCNETFQLGLKNVKKKWIFDSYCRILLDQILPKDIEKALYLDADVLVVDDLQALWDLDMRGCYVVAAHDGLSQNYYDLWGLSENASYCNSGVLLFDLKRCREENVTERIRRFVSSQHGYVFFMEQTTMNVVFDGAICILPPRYNLQTVNLCLSYQEMLALRKPVYYYNKQEFEEAKRHPAILHMTSNAFLVKNRAWVEGSNHPAAPVYQKYAKMTPWGEAAILPDTRGKGKRALDTVIAHIPRSILIPTVGWVYNHARIWMIRRTMRKITDEQR